MYTRVIAFRNQRWAWLSAVLTMLPLLRTAGAENSPLLLEPANWPKTGAAAETAPMPPAAASGHNTLQIRVAAQTVPTASGKPAAPASAVAESPPPRQTPAPVTPQPTTGPPDAESPAAQFHFPAAGAPSFDDENHAEELPSGIDPEHILGPVGVRPYGGGHPTDWSWGCGGSPYRTHGRCDNWKVGCAWRVTVDGVVWAREETNLDALEAQLRTNDPEGTLSGAVPLTPAREQFDYGPGGRITFMSQAPHYVGWDMMVTYEGVSEWHSSIVFPKLPLDPPPLPPPGSPDPLDPIDLATEQRRFHYTSTLHSGELNFVRGCTPTWRPYCGVRYIKFDDEINDTYDQQAPPPLPDQLGLPVTTTTVIDPGPPEITETVTMNPDLEFASVTDRLNLFDIQNNLMGFQVGLLHDTWHLNRRFAIEAYVNGGVYYNRIKYTNLMGTFTTQEVGDNLDTPTVVESQINFSNTTNNDVRELSEIAYVTESSISAVCRLNKCWALRSGYQFLWIKNVHLAEDAYLNGETEARTLFFHGWHAGIECRR